MHQASPQAMKFSELISEIDNGEVDSSISKRIVWSKEKVSSTVR
ncbi:hypothetical protein [Alteribacillus bidgolensis]|nr:hypothetical protein [Alteribacillus bidgolensis]